MNDTTRLIIAFILVLVVLFVWQSITPKRTIKSAPITNQTETVPPAVQPSQLAPATSNIITNQLPPPTDETEVILENDRFKITLSSYGASIKSVFLKKYKAELVPATSYVMQVRPIADSLKTENWSIVYQDDSTVIFQNFVKKSFQLRDRYGLSMKIEPVSATLAAYEIVYGAGLALTEANTKDEMRHFSLFYQTPQKTHKINAAKLKPTTLSDVKWIGLKSKYFTSILSCPNNQAIVNVAPLSDGRIGYIFHPITNAVDYLIYFGPLDYDILKSYKMGWEALNDLGWTKIFSVAILSIIKFLYSIFRNYGVAIIIFSILMKAIFFPLSRMSNKQMQQMQKLQPKMDELKKKYKDDPQALNRETMELYRLYKINPFSGCLPLIFQLPIFWALYSVLQKTIELRQASFVFWLKDLSLKDPLYILPILMGVSFLVQNFLTSADKKNMALLIFMPIFMTVIFLNFPSGLQLYWFLFNLLSIIESIISRGGIKWKKQKTLTTNPV